MANKILLSECLTDHDLMYETSAATKGFWTIQTVHARGKENNKLIENRIAEKEAGLTERDEITMTAIDDPWDRVYKTTQAYNYEKREEAFITNTTKEEALENAIQLIESEEVAKLKAERKEAKKKRQKERKKAEKAGSNNNKEKKTRSNSTTSSDNNVITKIDKTETSEVSEDENLGCADPEEPIDDEFLDINAAFVKVSVKQKPNSVPNKPPVPKPEKVSPPLDMPKVGKSKIAKHHSDRAVELGKQSCRSALYHNDFDRAIDGFTEAIFLNGEDVRHFINRSYCYLRLGQYSLALSDAQFAKKNAQSPEDFAKAMAREGQALCGLQQYHEAEKCFEEILKLEQGNKWILTELILARALQLTNMGFSKIDALKALQQCSAVVDAVTLLTSGNISSSGLETNLNKSETDDCDGDEIYFSDDEASSTNLLSKLVSTIADESCYLENLRSQPSSSKAQQYSNSSERTFISNNGSMESLPQINGNHSNGSAQWKVMNNFKSVASSSKIQTQKLIVPESSSIWVGNIEKSITDQKLREKFGIFGKINYIKRFTDDCKYVFIDFESKKAATEALNYTNGFEINGIKLPVKPPRRPYVKK